jgi:hypothetical protein
MPSLTRAESPTLSSSKKRRRDDDVDSHIMHEAPHLLSAIDHNERLIFPPNHHVLHHHNNYRGSSTNANINTTTTSLFSVSRKVIPLPSSKRLRPLEDAENASLQPREGFSHAHPEHPSPQPPTTTSTRPSIARAGSSAALLAPCHICHRKPTKKSDLDSFAECMGCGQRTCFVCIRACQGWLPEQQLEGDGDQDLSASYTMHDVDDEEHERHHEKESSDRQQRQHESAHAPSPKKDLRGGWSGHGHREVICSRCCVERGSEGDVVCLGCLAGMEGA